MDVKPGHCPPKVLKISNRVLQPGFLELELLPVYSYNQGGISVLNLTPPLFDLQ
jgi:hypothetical protein